MVALQIRDVSPETRDILARRAKESGQSLQAYLHELVEADASRNRNAEVLARIARRLDDGMRPEPGGTAAELREIRAAREAELASRA